MASRSHGWDARNIAKTSPKSVKKGHFWTPEGKRPKPTPLPHMRLWLWMSCSMTSLYTLRSKLLGKYQITSKHQFQASPEQSSYTSVF